MAAAPVHNPQRVRCTGACGQVVEVWANYLVAAASYECGACQVARTDARSNGLAHLGAMVGKPRRGTPEYREHMRALLAKGSTTGG